MMKKTMSLSLAAFCAVLLLSGCSMYTYPTYSVSLCQVEQPKDARQQFGETKIVSFSDENLTKYTFEDEYIQISRYVTRTALHFLLTNKSQHSVKIPWDDMVYVDILGQTGRVMHSGVKYIDRNNVQPASVVPRGATISDLVMPTDNVYYVSGQYGGWREKPLLPKFSTQEDIQASGVVGKSMRVLFPIQIENVTNEYTFEFCIDGATVGQ